MRYFATMKKNFIKVSRESNEARLYSDTKYTEH